MKDLFSSDLEYLRSGWSNEAQWGRGASPLWLTLGTDSLEFLVGIIEIYAGTVIQYIDPATLLYYGCEGQAGFLVMESWFDVHGPVKLYQVSVPSWMICIMV